MSTNQPLDSGPSFGKATRNEQNIKIPSFSQDSTFLNSIKESKLFNVSQGNLGIPPDKLYQCQICKRLRLVCPFNSGYNCNHSGKSQNVINQNRTKLNINRNSEFRSINQCRYCSKGRIKTNINNNRTSINNVTNPPTNFQPKPAVSFIQRPPSQHKHIYETPKRKPLVVEQVIYYPVFHNIYHNSRKTVKSTNPESIDKLQRTLASPNSKQRDRRSTKEPQSSPIRVQEYSDLIMTPQKIRELTQSMIN